MKHQKKSLGIQVSLLSGESNISFHREVKLVSVLGNYTKKDLHQCDAKRLSGVKGYITNATEQFCLYTVLYLSLTVDKKHLQ